jgi:hypothetical protein
MADVAEVRADISEMLRAIRINGCVPVMREALLWWQSYLIAHQESGLSAVDKQGYEVLYKQLKFLLTEVFPDEEGGDGQAS